MEWADGLIDPGRAESGPPGFEFDPTVDAGGDGVVDTMVFRADLASGEAGLVIAADLDGDGTVDRVTTFEDDGDFVRWEPGEIDSVWTVTERGSL
ncbi:DUF6802 family protein [Rhodococcoides kroppenstedtii]|uniref:DUF6802 family protein n=1 Tax=Rhodococcoides kroppenstedtii TaxID=293050 RepID=UPI001427C2FE|nr:DUF6802 family protein [Rhodococcus kroppenstedtii]NIL79402.1 hypothetical protein [Rhodococcus kroppenstedtii]